MEQDNPLASPGSRCGLAPEESDEAALITTVNIEHRLTMEAIGDAISFAYTSKQHAIRAGEALILLKSAHDSHSGEWDEWVKANLECTKHHVHAYIRVATYKDILPEEITTFSEARRYLQGLPLVGQPGPRPTPPETKQLAIQLRRAGASFSEIAAITGVSASTAHILVDPAYERQVRNRVAEHQRRRAQERAALEREKEESDRRRLVKEADPDLSKAWASARRALQHNQAALDDGKAPEDRENLRAAMAHGHRYLDGLEKAMRWRRANL